jgi:hypothetical protein
MLGRNAGAGSGFPLERAAAGAAQRAGTNPARATAACPSGESASSNSVARGPDGGSRATRSSGRVRR